MQDHRTDVETRNLMSPLNGPDGGIGYLLKDRTTNIESSVVDVKRVAAGGTAVDPVVVERVLTHPRAHASLLAPLSPREREILALMAEGRSNSGIASALFLAERTVETHIRGIFLRLGIEQQTDVNRRVLAVLTYFRDQSNPVAVTPAMSREFRGGLSPYAGRR